MRVTCLGIGLLSDEAGEAKTDSRATKTKGPVDACFNIHHRQRHILDRVQYLELLAYDPTICLNYPTIVSCICV